MNKILTSAAAVTLICLGASAPAKAQEFFANAYSRPVEMVDGLNVGTRVGTGGVFAPVREAAAPYCHAGTACGRRQIAH